METLVTRREIEPGIWLDSRRALWLQASRSLIVADLHWGYAASHRAAGNLLPLWGDETLTNTLRALIDDYEPAEMIWLGDVIHARAGEQQARTYLRGLSDLSVVLVRGNHDRSWHERETCAVVRRGQFVLHHGHESQVLAADERELVGHYHPALAWSDGAGTRLRLPALVSGPRRWILPAFSPWAAGVPWLTELAPDELLWAIAPRRIFAVPAGGMRRTRSSA